MEEKKKITSLNWDQFRALGNPENAPEEEPENEELLPAKFDILIYKERKKRKGKTVTLVKGIELPETQLKVLAKELKQYCGVGGTVEGFDILLQGDQRIKAEKYLKRKSIGTVRVAN